MTGLMSKRQQARNEKVLQDLVHNVAGNNFCADCQARNPSWASWSLGVFLCMRCAAIHRKLGTHISKVKSLSMDSWTNDQVENMKKVGNVASNQIYNPQNKKPPVPIDADEADSAMERFIRSKYVQSGTTNGARQPRSGSVVSDEGTPPPLPPKTGGRFGFKSGSSTFPLSFRSKRESRSRDGPTSPNGSSEYDPNTLRSKPSKVFGASVQNDSAEAMAQKLTQLREMGFMDEKRNTMVLKGVNGNLEKTIEALVRLGEGSGATTPIVPSRDSSLPVSRSLTPQPTAQTTIGLSRASPKSSRSPATPSNNPWDIQPARPQSTQSTGTMQHNKNPFFNTNPFGVPSGQSEFNLNQSMQNLSVGPSQQQQLFPHHTGGLPATQPPSQAFYQQPMTPPMPQNNQFPNAVYDNGRSYSTPVSQVQQSYNPFLQAPANQPLAVNTMQLQGQSPNQSQNPFGNNPYTRSPSIVASPSLNQIPEQSQQNVYHSPQNVYGTNPFFVSGQSVQPQPVQQQQHQAPYQFLQQQQHPQQQQPQQPQQPQQQQVYYQSQQAAQPSTQQPFAQQSYAQQPFAQQPFAQQAFSQQAYQQPQRPDKASIMALYNIPSTTPVPQPQVQVASAGPQGNQAGAAQSPPPQPQSPERTAPGTRNPFMNNNGAAPTGPAGFAGASGSATTSGGARSRESMALGMEMAWNNGRHSPDAFANLSARTG